MYARNVSINLKPGSAKQFTQKVEQDILPLLKRQDGFQDAITLLPEGGKYAIAITLWDGKESAETYGRNTYPEILNDPHVQFNKLVREMTLPNGRQTKTVAFPMKISGYEFSVYRNPPQLGEHNEEVFAEWLGT